MLIPKSEPLMHNYAAIVVDVSKSYLSCSASKACGHCDAVMIAAPPSLEYRTVMLAAQLKSAPENCYGAYRVAKVGLGRGRPADKANNMAG
eukprot:960847-Amphidinium_carterae.3